ncbi:DltD domain-containing protein [Nemania serpens]|nr:DltD domain-containing protein [Nemania serpens]
MGASPRHRPIDCKTIDGTIISAWLYEVKGPSPSPAIIMSHGFNCVKEMTLPEVAEGFHARGYNVLLYDARSVGGSEGQPRNLINPLQMAEDLSDIYTCVSRLSTVDSRSIVLWGMSFGGAVSATCAAVDRRAKAVIMMCPLFSYVKAEQARVDRAFMQVVRDRVSQLRGNEAASIQPFTPDGDNGIGMGGAGGPGGVEAYQLMRAAIDKGAAGFRDRIALQTYQKLALFRPTQYLDMVAVPTLLVIPESDDISPPQEQLDAFEKIRAPKKVHWAKGKTHLNVVSGEGSAALLDMMDEFIRAVLQGESIE